MTDASVKMTITDPRGGVQTVYLCRAHADKLPPMPGSHTYALENVRIIGTKCEACMMAASKARPKVVAN